MTVSKLTCKMIKYFSDRRFVEHALKVYSYAYTIAELEGIKGDELLTIQCAAILHDIGIPNAIKIHGSGKGPFQEKEGALLVPEFAGLADIPEALIPKITWLVGNHHTHEKSGEDILLQILMEADYLVNLSESPDRYKLDDVKDFFKTKTGKEYLSCLFFNV